MVYVQKYHALGNRSFVQIDPIGILKSYVEDLQDNLVKMREQIGKIKGQMRKLTTLMQENNEEIDKNMKLASAAKAKGIDSQVVLATRKAAWLRESNEKYSFCTIRWKCCTGFLPKCIRILKSLWRIPKTRFS